LLLEEEAAYRRVPTKVSQNPNTFAFAFRGRGCEAAYRRGPTKVSHNPNTFAFAFRGRGCEAAYRRGPTKVSHNPNTFTFAFPSPSPLCANLPPSAPLPDPMTLFPARGARGRRWTESINKSFEQGMNLSGS